MQACQNNSDKKQNSRLTTADNSDVTRAIDTTALNERAVLYVNYWTGCPCGQLQGSVGPALMNTNFKHGEDFNSIKQSIHDGIAGTEMIAFSNTLSNKQIENITTYIIPLGGCSDQKVLGEDVLKC